MPRPFSAPPARNRLPGGQGPAHFCLPGRGGRVELAVEVIRRQTRRLGRGDPPQHFFAFGDAGSFDDDSAHAQVEKLRNALRVEPGQIDLHGHDDSSRRLALSTPTTDR